MVALFGPLAMILCELRQAWKGATVTERSCAGMWLIRAATLSLKLLYFQCISAPAEMNPYERVHTEVHCQVFDA